LFMCGGFLFTISEIRTAYIHTSDILEYCKRGSLDKLIYGPEVILEEQVVHIVRGIALGMFHLHQHKLIHRDLASRNILLSNSYDPKIADFGMHVTFL